MRFEPKVQVAATATNSETELPTYWVIVTLRETNDSLITMHVHRHVVTEPRVEKAYEKHAWIIPFALAASFLIEGLFVALTSGVYDPNLQTVAGTTWDKLSSTYPVIASFIVPGNRIFGVTLLGFGFFMMAISLKSYRRGEKWSWYALCSFSVLLGLGTAFEFSAGAVSQGQSGTIFVMVSLLGLLLPYRKFFPKTRSAQAATKS